MHFAIKFLGSLKKSASCGNVVNLYLDVIYTLIFNRVDENQVQFLDYIIMEFEFSQRRLSDSVAVLFLKREVYIGILGCSLCDLHFSTKAFFLA